MVSAIGSALRDGLRPGGSHCGQSAQHGCGLMPFKSKEALCIGWEVLCGILMDVHFAATQHIAPGHAPDILHQHNRNGQIHKTSALAKVFRNLWANISGLPRCDQCHGKALWSSSPRDVGDR